MTKTYLLSLLFFGLFFSIQAQPIENDHCDDAITIVPGQIISGINNERATISELELPEPDPSTCIKTFENDLWYTFTTVEGFDYYKVVVNPLSCNTPAGLQGMIIQTDNCESSSYIYRACANPYSESSIEMVIEDSVPGNRYLIYIDGYDGTECVFSLKLEGSQRNAQSTTADIRQLQNDYGNPPPLFEPENFYTEFLNNEATIFWSVPTSEDVSLFLVERYIKTSYSTYGRVIGRVEPVAVVSMDETPLYSFTHRTPFTDEKEYCYRIVKVNSQGEKAYTNDQCLQANLAKDFFITPVEPAEDGMYYINFRNFKKQDLVFSVLNQSQEILKQLTRAKEPKRDGQIKINMSEYEPGVYFLKVEGKSEFFLRRFSVK